VRTIVFDKTGTLTVGKPSLVRSTLDDAALRLAAAVEAGSEHPFAMAILDHARSRGVTWPNAEEIQAEAGWGVRGVVDGQRVEIGRGPRTASSTNDAVANSHAIVTIDGQIVGMVEFADEVRSTAADAIAALRKYQLDVVMLSGDRRVVAERVARELGIPKVIAETLPTEKHAVMEQLRPHVAMVGDGINDAAALAAADVGIAMGTGSDLAKSAASITLLRADLALVPDAIELSRRIVRTIRQNLWLAFGYNAVMVPLAACGILSPIIAAAAMSLSSMSVIGNSLRLRRGGQRGSSR
jgi:P-type Cu+ transporter